MAYHERALTVEESRLAQAIRDCVPRRLRLDICQRVCTMMDDQRERVDEAFIAGERGYDVRKRIWKRGHFPRYRFFDVALPGEAWGKFADSEEETRT